MKSFRQKHLAACYGKQNFGFRRAVFVQAGVSVHDWSMCEWCATHGCAEGLKLELVIKDECFTCDCIKDHPRVHHESSSAQMDLLLSSKAALEEAREEVYEAKFDLYRDVGVEEPLSYQRVCTTCRGYQGEGRHRRERHPQ